MSVAQKAVRGVMWNMVTGVGVRVLGLVTTLVLTHYISPYDYGEVQAAFVCVLTAQVVSNFGFGQYLIAKNAPPDEAWNATVLHVGFGIVAQSVVLALSGPLSSFLNAPTMDRFLPGFAAIMVVERFYYTPERLLHRGLRFKATALTRSAGEVGFIVSALVLAPRYGGYAIVYGSFVRSCLVTIVYLVITDRSEWLHLSRLRRDIIVRLMHFGGPTWIGNVAGFGAQKWDNLIMARLYGPTIMGRYVMAYSLADTPTQSVADQIGDVLLPSFSKLEPERRVDALIRACGLMSLITFPMALGLGAVSHTVVHAFFKPEWYPMAPMLLILSVMSVVKPMTWPMGAFAFAEHRPRITMFVGLWQLAAVAVLLLTVGRLNPLAACAAVGFAHASYLAAFAVALERTLGVSATRVLGAGLRPLLAGAVMVGAVFAARAGLVGAGLDSARLRLPIEIAAGAAVFAVAAFVIARPQVSELVRLLKAALARRRGG